VTNRLFRLVIITAALTLGHHVDHIIRGNHVGWPFSPTVTPFTFSLAVYPAVIVGLHLSLRGRVGPGYWAVLWGAMTLLAASVHLPLSENSETAGDIIGPYASPLAGWLAFLWLLALVVAAMLTSVEATRLWVRRRHEQRTTSTSPSAREAAIHE
jgi:hypothetical protein